ncbi:hypothetical protein [Hymenobacter setariae]|nr:hypothetical protein [Hymenobacter setariae]
MARGYRRRQERKEREEVEQWRRTRLVATILVNAHRGASQLAQSPEEFMALPGDPPPAPPMSEETFDETMARLAEFDNLQTAA